MMGPRDEVSVQRAIQSLYIQGVSRNLALLSCAVTSNSLYKEQRRGYTERLGNLFK